MPYMERDIYPPATLQTGFHGTCKSALQCSSLKGSPRQYFRVGVAFLIRSSSCMDRRKGSAREHSDDVKQNENFIFDFALNIIRDDLSCLSALYRIACTSRFQKRDSSATRRVHPCHKLVAKKTFSP